MVQHPKTGQQVAAATLARELGLTYQQLRYKLMEEGKWPSHNVKEQEQNGGLNDGGEALETDACS